MKKQSLALLLIGLAATLSVVIAVRSAQRGTPVSPIGSPAPSAVGGTSLDISDESPLHNLADSTLLLAVLTPRYIEPLLVQVERILDRITSSGIWKKLELDKEIDKAVDKRRNRNGGLQGACSEDLRELSRKAREWLAQVREIALVVSRKTVKLANGIEIPCAMLVSKFQDPETSKRLLDHLRRDLLKGKPGVERQEFTFAKVADAENSFRFSVKLGNQGQLAGILRIDVSEARAYINTENENDFLARKGEARLLDASEWHDLMPVASLPQSFQFLYFDIDSFADYYSALLKKLAEIHSADKDEQFIAGMSGIYSQISAATLQVAFAPGLVIKRCGLMKPESSFEKRFRETLGKRPTEVAGDSAFNRLITPKTVLAVRLSRALLDLTLGTFKEGFNEAIAKAKDGDKNAPAAMERIENFIKLVDEFGFSEIGLVADGALPPQGGVYLGNGSLAAEEALPKLKEGIETLLARDSKIKDLKLSLDKDASGRSLLKVQAGDRQAVVGAVSERSLMLAYNESYIAQSAAALESGTPYFDRIDLDSVAMKETFENSDFFVYLSSSTLVEMAKPFLAMALGSRPDTKISPEDLSEALDIFDFSALFVQTSYEAGDRILCSDQQAALVSLRK